MGFVWIQKFINLSWRKLDLHKSAGSRECLWFFARKKRKKCIGKFGRFMGIIGVKSSNKNMRNTNVSQRKLIMSNKKMHHVPFKQESGGLQIQTRKFVKNLVTELHSELHCVSFKQESGGLQIQTRKFVKNFGVKLHCVSFKQESGGF